MRGFVAFAIAAGLTGACKGDQAAAPTAEAGSAAVGTGSGSTGSARKGPSLDAPVTITLPLADGAITPPRARFVAKTATGLWVLPEGEPPAVGADGTLAIAGARSVTVDELGAALPADAIAVLIADARAHSSVLQPVIGALGLRCWALGVASGGKLGALAPQPCPPPAPTDPDLVQLAIWLGPDGNMVGLSRVNELTAIPDLDTLDLVLREHKRSAFFEDRTDLAIAADTSVQLGALVAAYGRALRAGFTAARWIPAAALPVRFAGGGDGSGGTAPSVDPTAPAIDGRTQRRPGAPTAGSTGSGGPRPTVLFGPVRGELGGLTEAEVSRVVKARTGVLRACYQRELGRDPSLSGEIELAATVAADGTVEKVAATGALSSGQLGACVTAQVRRMRFPAKGGAEIHFRLDFTAE